MTAASTGMPGVLRAIALVVLVAAAFFAGYWFREWRSQFNGQMEDYALTNILDNVGYAAYLGKGDTEKVRELIDISLNGHLRRVIQFQGSMDDARAEEAKIRTLNAVARLWDQRPPINMEERVADPATAFWLPEWKEMTARNMKLLQWAKDQCASRPELKCRTGPIGK